MAINDIIAMSASTLSNLKRIGLFEKDIINKKIRINKLFKLALEKVANLPFFLVQELWRWKLFEGMTIEKSFAYLRNLRYVGHCCLKNPFLNNLKNSRGH